MEKGDDKRQLCNVLDQLERHQSFSSDKSGIAAHERDQKGLDEGHRQDTSGDRRAPSATTRISTPLARQETRGLLQRRAIERVVTGLPHDWQLIVRPGPRPALRARLIAGRLQ
jgi:hypothetical protein